jgi:flagellin
MRINTNVASINAQKNLWNTQQAQSRSMDKLSSGFRINRAGDDAAGLGIANQLRADNRSLQQAFRNAEQGNSVLQVAEGSTSTIQKMLERMKELATQAASDTVDGGFTAGAEEGEEGVWSGGRARLQTEFTELLNEIDRIIGSTKFQGTKLLDGKTDDPGFTFQIGSDSSSDSRLTVKLGDLSTVGLGLSKSEEGDEGEDPTISASFDLGSIDNARDAMDAIDTALGTVNSTLGDIGAYQNRLEYTMANLKTTIQNNAAAESVIRDLDMAEEMTNFSKLGILSQAGQAMLAQANQSTQGVLQLLRG